MKRAALPLLLAVLLAGCGGGGPPPDPPAPADHEPTPQPGVVRELRESWVANGTFTLGTPQARQEAQVTLPNGTEKVDLTLVFERGTVASFHADLNGCPLDVPGPEAATGQERWVDCGKMEGPRTLVLQQPAGVVAGRYGVRALVWQTTQRS